MTGPNQVTSSGSPAAFNILKERLRATGGAAGSSAKDSPNQSPFIMTAQGHPGFQPQKVGKGTDSKAPKPPKPPEKPIMPYMRYSRKVWDQVKAQNPELKLWEIGKIIGQMWRDLPDNEKTEYIEDYETEKLEYEKNLKAYHNSPGYLAFIVAKSRIKTSQQSSEDRESHDRSTSSSKQDRRIDIQPAEDDDEPEDHFSVKNSAYNRFMRNHRLINEIFSDSIVPDVRSVITTTRMQVLNRQLQSLTSHNKKLEGDIQEMVEQFEATKRKFKECNEAFHDELKKHCQRAVDEETFQQMVERQVELIRKERQKGMAAVLEEPVKKEDPVTPTSQETPDSASNTSDTIMSEDTNSREPIEAEQSHIKEDASSNDTQNKEPQSPIHAHSSYIPEQGGPPPVSTFPVYPQNPYPQQGMPMYSPGYPRYPVSHSYSQYHHGYYPPQPAGYMPHQYPRHHFVPSEPPTSDSYPMDNDSRSVTNDKPPSLPTAQERKPSE